MCMSCVCMSVYVYSLQVYVFTECRVVCFYFCILLNFICLHACVDDIIEKKRKKGILPASSIMKWRRKLQLTYNQMLIPRGG